MDISLGMHGDFLISLVCSVAFECPNLLYVAPKGGKSKNEGEGGSGASPLNSLEVTLASVAKVCNK